MAGAPPLLQLLAASVTTVASPTVAVATAQREQPDRGSTMDVLYPWATPLRHIPVPPSSFKKRRTVDGGARPPESR
ncbi:hypothetical protein E2562_031892 [Oryza meyeriana var. granulata]|uniref:Secreted protein n=1 Tax=Oryza meyeriana var. granulata TaxID=110450 RepID=A0A6G1F080_9ORYZ|nr:hypothetical protein E2562_031892 [Oryza meyeriana var. granulata]